MKTSIHFRAVCPCGHTQPYDIFKDQGHPDKIGPQWPEGLHILCQKCSDILVVQFNFRIGDPETPIPCVVEVIKRPQSAERLGNQPLHPSCKSYPQCNGRGQCPVANHHDGGHHLEPCERCGGVGAVSKYR